MRVNIYAEEMTERVEIISKEIDGHTFTGLRLYLELPVTRNPHEVTRFEAQPDNLQGPFIHRPGDDDSAAVTFWGKRDLRVVLKKMLAQLDAHYAARDAAAAFGTNTGHGHVWDRPDGMKARCGGPSICQACSLDAVRFPPARTLAT